MLPAIEHRIAADIGAKPAQVIAAVALLDEGATVPFISRYRKEVTGGLDDTQLRLLEERLSYLRELEERRLAVIASVEEQGKMTPALLLEFNAAETKQRLEDLYLPYKQKRRTKAQIAREAGLEPLADALMENPQLKPEDEAAKYINTENAEAPVPDVKAALDGARQILMERFAEDAGLLGKLREQLQENGILTSVMAEGKEQEGAKFRDYFVYSEKIADIPSHRALALFRGRNEDILRIALKMPEELQDPPMSSPCE
ncbi:MAG TPA: Tex-like N-terminal domain-containing protein, partial [Rhodocyclaceae bacterium]|nr:Tex-like N-terminal domain-containing protein [Rhodocyclaceae bacterium]